MTKSQKEPRPNGVEVFDDCMKHLATCNIELVAFCEYYDDDQGPISRDDGSRAQVLARHLLDALEPLHACLAELLLGMSGLTDVSGLQDVEIQLCLSLWPETMDVIEEIAAVAGSYNALQDYLAVDKEKRQLALAATHHLAAVSELGLSLIPRSSLHPTSRTAALLRASTFIAPFIAESWPKMGPYLRTYGKLP